MKDRVEGEGENEDEEWQLPSRMKRVLMENETHQVELNLDDVILPGFEAVFFRTLWHANCKYPRS